MIKTTFLCLCLIALCTINNYSQPDQSALFAKTSHQGDLSQTSETHGSTGIHGPDSGTHDPVAETHGPVAGTHDPVAETHGPTGTHGPVAGTRDPGTGTHGPANGTLLVIGGGASNMFYEKFMELVGGPDSPIVVIPTAQTSDVLDAEDLESFKKRFIDKGFNNVTVLHTRDPNEANSDIFIQPILQAAGIWFSGGRQWRHADSYLNTKTHRAFFDLLNRGGVIAGSSAGATIQGSYLARGDTKANTIMMGDHEEGLGFITELAIDQHLFARNRQFDLFEILENRPELLGIGLDENTGIIVQGDQFEVLGESYVCVYDGTRWSAERDTIYQLPAGSHDFYTLKEGQKYDLDKRRVILD